MVETYKHLKTIISQDTAGRSNFIDETVRKLGLTPQVYELDSPRGKDRHLIVTLDKGKQHDLWLTANYDTFDKLPSANNNASGVVSLLGVLEHVKGMDLPVNVRVAYFDAGLDTDLIIKRRRNPDFIPGSEVFLQHMINNEIEFIDTFDGALVVQAVGKGGFCVYERTGRKFENSKELNGIIIAYGKTSGTSVELKDQSPNADNLPFLKEGLTAAVLARYHEGAWHRMQTIDDDMSNVNVQSVDETIVFLYKLVESYPKGEK